MKKSLFVSASVLLILSLLAFPGLLMAQESGVPATEGAVDVPAASGPFGEARPLTNGGLLYLTSLDSGNTTFSVYDPGTDTWMALNGFDTSCQMAVSDAGELFAHNYNSGDIDIYDPGTDSWAYYMDGPPVSINTKCNLEVTNDGEFFLTVGNTADLYYTSGGSWSTFSLPFNANAMGDYDPTTNQYVIGEYGTVNAHLIDVATFAITSFTLGPGSNGEWGRFSSILNNRYYYCTNTNPIYSYDLSDPGLPAYDHGVYPGFYVASAADRANNLIYTASLDGADLWAFDATTDTLIPLTGHGYIGNHSSLAFVAAAAENTLHVGGIKAHFVGNQIRANVLVLDETDAPVAGVDVLAKFIAPGWPRPYQGIKTTNAYGMARFPWSSPQSGDWKICVEDLAKSGYTYDPGSNVITCKEWFH